MEHKILKRTLCILVLVLTQVYINASIYIDVKYFNRIYFNRLFFDLMALSSALVIVCFFYSFSKKQRMSKKSMNICITLSCILTVTVYILYFAYLPKYTIKEAYAIVKEDPKYMSVDVSYGRYGEAYPNEYLRPFEAVNYMFSIKYDENSFGEMYFNPYTGEYGFY